MATTPPTYGPIQFPKQLDLRQWQFERALRLHLVPPPDAGDRWSETAFTEAQSKIDTIKADVGEHPDVGSWRAENYLAQRFSVEVARGTAAELARRGHLPITGEYKGAPLYCGLTLERGHSLDRRKVRRASAAGALHMRDEAAQVLGIRPADLAHLVRAGLLTPAETVHVRRRVTVLLYRHADLTRLRRSRRIDWAAIDATPPGRPSPLATLPTAPARAQDHAAP
ncbi:hypothetical protein ACFVUW_10300 [Streptomyces xiamenensis]|uniref:hypothetical protein n=1 Tax=Streptomyces xiamenensis TaxID=408015 RepID=UPI0036E6EE74